MGDEPWSYAVETGTRVLRLVLSGMFDRHPRLRKHIEHPDKDQSRIVQGASPYYG
jgi:hypothetical protein